MDNLQFWMLMGVIIALFSSVNYFLLSSIVKVEIELRNINKSIKSLENQVFVCSQNIEKLLQEILKK